MSLYAKRLERGRFVWPSAKDGTIAISASAMAYVNGGRILGHRGGVKAGQ
jgi:transposase